jgi:hypothetical protein
LEFRIPERCPDGSPEIPREIPRIPERCPDGSPEIPREIPEWIPESKLK